MGDVGRMELSSAFLRYFCPINSQARGHEIILVQFPVMLSPPPTHTPEGLGLDNACVFFQLKRRVPWQDEWGTLSLLEPPASPGTRQWPTVPVGLVLALNAGRPGPHTPAQLVGEPRAFSLRLENFSIWLHAGSWGLATFVL